MTDLTTRSFSRHWSYNKRPTYLVGLPVYVLADFGLPLLASLPTAHHSAKYFLKILSEQESLARTPTTAFECLIICHSTLSIFGLSRKKGKYGWACRTPLYYKRSFELEENNPSADSGRLFFFAWSYWIPPPCDSTFFIFPKMYSPNLRIKRKNFYASR